MTNKEILEKAISLAIDGGWNLKAKGSSLWNPSELALYFTVHNPYELGSLIFNHDFARALWGERRNTEVVTPYIRHGTNWEHHLQAMVIAEDPIKYLGDNI